MAGGAVPVEEPQEERGALALAEGEVGGDARPVAGERQRGGEAEAQARAVEAGAVLAQVRLVMAAGVVEGGPALQAERHPPADDPHAPDELVGGGPACAPTGM